MVRLFICFFFMIWGAASYGADAQYTISINAPTNVVKSGQNISLDITYTNDSSEIAWIPAASGCACIKVWREDGKPLSLTREGRYSYGQPSAIDIKEDKYWFSRSQPNGHASGVEPGISGEDHVIVNQFYDMTAPGDYLIQIEHSVPPFPPGLIVKSNVINVTVTN